MIRRYLAVLLIAVMLTPSIAIAQLEKAGVITTLEGNVTARRVALPAPVPLKFKDDVFLQDTLTTGDNSLARMLLGGKAVVTVRERSVLTITEVPGRSTIELSSGKFALAAAREKMRPGEEIQIRTPNAVAGVRGTVVITEVSRQTAQTGGPPAGVITHFYVLRGSITAQPLTGGSVSVGTMQGATIAGGAPPRVVPIPLEQIGQITAGLQPSGKTAAGVGQQDIKTQAVQTAVTLLAALSGEQEAFSSAIPPALIVRPEVLSTPGQREQTVTGTTLDVINPGGEAPVGISNLTAEILGISNLILSSSQTLTPVLPPGLPPLPAPPCTGCVRISGLTFSLSGTAFQSFSGSFVSTSSLELLGIDTSLISQTGSSVSFIELLSGANVSVAGLLLALTNSTITTTGTFLSVDNATLASQSSSALLTLDPSTLNAATLVSITGPGGVSLAGPLISDVGGTFHVSNDFVAVSGGSTLTNTSTSPLMLLSGSSLTVGTTGLDTHLFTVNHGASVTLAGPLLNSTGSAITASGAFGALVDVFATATLTSTTTAPFIQLSGGSLTLGPGARTINVGDPGPATLSVAGSLFKATNTTMAVNTGAPFIRVDGGTLTAGGSLLDLTNTTVNLGSQSLISLASASHLTTTAGPVINLTGGSLTAGALLAGDGTGNLFTLTGPGLSLTNTTVTLGSVTLGSGSDVLTLVLAPNQPQLAIASSALTLTGVGANLTGLGDNIVPPAVVGTALVATGTLASPSTITLSGDVLRMKAGTFTATNPLVQLDHTTITQTGPTPLIRIDPAGLLITMSGPLLRAAASTVNASGPIVTLESGTLNSTGGGTLIDATTSVVNAATNMLVISHSALSLAGPLLAANGGQLTTANTSDLLTMSTATLISSGTGNLIDLTSGAAGTLGHVGGVFGSMLSLAGPLLTANGTQLTTAFDMFFMIGSTLTSSTTSPLNTLTNGAVANIGGSLVNTTGSSLSLGGPLLTLNNSRLTTGGDFLALSALASVIATTGNPLVKLTDSTLKAGLSFLQLDAFSSSGSPSTFVTGGDLLRLETATTGSIVNIGGALVQALNGGFVIVPGAGLVFVGPNNAVNITNSTAPTNTIFGVPVQISSGGFVSLGPSTGLNLANVLAGGSAISASGVGTLVTINPMLLPSGPFLTFTGSVPLGGSIIASFEIGALAAPPSGPLTNVLNTTIISQEDPLQGGSGLGQGMAQLAGPVVRITGATLNNSVSFSSLVNALGNSLALAGSLLEITNSTVDTTGGSGSLLGVGGSTPTTILKTYGSAPLIQISNSTVLVSNSFVAVAGSSFADPNSAVIALSGPLLAAGGTSGSTLSTTAGAFIDILPGTITSSTTQPLVQLANSSLSVSGAFLSVGCQDTCQGNVTLAGPLLAATNSNLTIGNELVLASAFDSQVVSTSTLPFVSLAGGSHSLGAFGVPVFHLSGANTALETDPDAPASLTVGTDQPLKIGGGLFEASAGAIINSGNISSPQPFIAVDQALFAASAPLVTLTSSSMTHNGDLLGLGSSAKVTANIPNTPLNALVKLDASTLTVNNGYFFGLKGGSFLNVVGNLLSLTNGSTVTINNGALVTVVDGTSGSFFKLTGGSLVVFGAGSNTVTINGTAATNTIGGVPVLLTGGAVAGQVQVAPGFTPFVGGAPGGSGAVLVVNGANSKVVLKP